MTRMNLRHIISQLVWECFSVASCLFVSVVFPQVFPFLITLVLCLALFSVCLSVCITSCHARSWFLHAPAQIHVLMDFLAVPSLVLV